MTLTKFDFEAIAEILHDYLDISGWAVEDLTDRFADYFETENPSFDRQLFRAAVFDGKIGLKDAKRKKVNE